MNKKTKSSTERPAWNALVAHHQKVRDLHRRKLFADDSTRGERMTIEAAGLYLDYSKNRVTDETLKLLVQLADESRLRERIDSMFRGDKINVTENRAVLHVALRANRQVKNSCDRDRSRNHPCRRTFSVPGAEGGGASRQVVFIGARLTT